MFKGFDYCVYNILIIFTICSLFIINRELLPQRPILLQQVRQAQQWQAPVHVRGPRPRGLLHQGVPVPAQTAAEGPHRAPREPVRYVRG